MNSRQKEERIEQIALQMKRLTSELTMLLGLVDSSVKEVTGNPDVILDIVTNVFGTNPRLPGRKEEVVLARHAATYLLNRYTRLTGKQISVLQGGVEHSVVSYRIAKAKELISGDETFRNQIQECIFQIEMRL